MTVPSVFSETKSEITRSEYRSRGGCARKHPEVAYKRGVRLTRGRRLKDGGDFLSPASKGQRMSRLADGLGVLCPN